MNEKKEEVFEGEVMEVEESIAIRDKNSDLVLGTQAAHQALELRARGLQALRTATIKALSEKDFHMFGGNAWLESSGVAKVSTIYGVCYSKPKFSKVWKDRFDEETKEVFEKDYYVYVCEITATFALDNNRSYTGTGSASTRDDFYMRKDGGGNSFHPHYLNVDEEDVMKKAETNCRARCLMGLGLASFTMEELKATGMDTTKSTGHDFKSAMPKGEPSDKQWGFLKTLLAKKVDGFDSEKLFAWIKTEKLDSKQASNLIDWLTGKADGSVDYKEQFQVEFEGVIKGLHRSKEEKK